MGKIKKGDKAQVLQAHRHEFVNVPQRSMIVVSMEGGKINPPLESIPEGAIVKIVQRYSEIEAERANQELETALRFLKSRVRYIRPPERIVLRRQTRRIEQLQHTMSVVEAVQVWIEKRPPSKADPEAVMQRFLGFLAEYPDDFERQRPSNLIIHSMVIQNFMPFRGEFWLEDIPNGLVGVIGQYDSQEGRSNRAGKSAFFDAILWGLFGEGRKVQSLDEVLCNGADRMQVGIAASFDGEMYPISRTYHPSSGTSVAWGEGAVQKTSGEVKVNSLKVREANAEIVKLIGMTRDDFVRTCCVQQGDLESILSRTSSALKEDIIRWRGLGVWAKLETSAKAWQSNIQSDINGLKARFEIACEALDKGKPTKKDIADLKAKLKRLRKMNEEARAARDRLALLQHQLENAQHAADLAERAKGLMRAEMAANKAQKNLEGLQNAYGTEKANLLEAKKEYQKRKAQVMHGFDGVCPVDGDGCPRMKEISNNVSAAQASLDQATSVLSVAEDREKRAMAAMGMANREANSERGKVAGLSHDASLAESYKGPSVEDAKAELEAGRELANYEEADLSSLEIGLADMLSAVKSYNEANTVKEKVKAGMEERTQELMVAHYLRSMCGKFGIPSMLIEDALEEISTQVNLILEDLGTDHRLTFDSERELKRPARVCYECGSLFADGAKEKFCPECGRPRGKDRTDELRPMIVEGDRKQTFGQDSGGGRALVALATRVAMSRFLGATILVFDEVSGALDPYHQALLIRFLHKLPSLGFHQVFVISHQKEVDDTMPSRIVATRYQDEDRSELAIG